MPAHAQSRRHLSSFSEDPEHVLLNLIQLLWALIEARPPKATKAALDLERLATELGLTHRQRRWAEEMVMRCDGNISAAARAAGVIPKAGSDYNANPRIHTFMAAMREAASGPVAEELELVLYEAAHSLARLTEIAEGRVPVEVKRAVVHMTDSGEPVTHYETYSILDAAKHIFDWYHPPAQAASQAPSGQTVVANIASLPPEQQGPARAQIKEKVLQMLGPKGGGE